MDGIERGPWVHRPLLYTNTVLCTSIALICVILLYVCRAACYRHVSAWLTARYAQWPRDMSVPTLARHATMPGEMAPVPNPFCGSFDAACFDARHRLAVLGDVYVVWSMWWPVLIIANPTAAADFLSSEQDKHGRDFAYLGSVFQRLMGHSLGYYCGREWSRLHRILAPCFRSPESDFDAISRQTSHDVMRLPLRMLAMLIYGDWLTDVERREITALSLLHDQLTNDMNCPWTRVPTFSYWPHPINTRVQEFQRRWKTLNHYHYQRWRASDGSGTCIFDRLAAHVVTPVENDIDDVALARQNKKMTYHEFLDTLYELLMFNVEISGSSTAWALLTVAEHPSIQTRLRDEMNEEKLDFQTLSNLTYLNHVVLESARLHPGLTVSFPEQTHKPMTIGGYRVPKGVYVSIDAQSLNRNPSVWERPDHCVPSRFDGLDMKSGDDRWRMHSFGLGVRQCLGRHYATLLVKLVLWHMCHRYKSIALHPPTLDAAASSTTQALPTVVSNVKTTTDIDTRSTLVLPARDAGIAMLSSFRVGDVTLHLR